MINITNEDNMLLMARYEDNYFDLAIIDPPYGIGMDKNPCGRLSKYGSVGLADNNPPTKKYFNELFRVSKNQVIWGGNYFIEYLYNTRCFLIWDKQQPESVSFASSELAWTSFNTSVKTFYKRPQNADNIRIHPTQKPVKLYEWLLMNYATCKTCNNEGGYYEDVAGDGGSQMWQHCDDCDGETVKILDTHLGSGSIALACHNLGFDLTACELDKDYYIAACKRLKEHQQQLTMF